MQLFFNAKKFLGLFFLDAGDGNAGPAANDIFNVFAANNAGSRVIEMVLVAQSTQVFALFAFFVGVEARLLKFMIGNG